MKFKEPYKERLRNVEYQNFQDEREIKKDNKKLMNQKKVQNENDKLKTWLKGL